MKGRSRMQIEELKTFVAVVDSKNFTKAARLLDIAQPTVSLHIKNLEAALETTLLTRTSRNFHVTPAGRLLYERALEMIDLTDRTKIELSQTTALKGILRIAASPVIAQAILPDVLTRLHAKYPDMRLELTTVPTFEINRLVKGKKADVGCSELDDLPSSYAFMQDELVLVASATHPLAQKRGTSILDLQNVHWILPDNKDASRALIDQALAQYGVQVKPTVMGSPESIKQAVLSGLGIAILSRHVCKRELAKGELTVLDYKVTPIKRTLYAGTRSSTHEVEAFLDELEAYCRLWQD